VKDAVEFEHYLCPGQQFLESYDLRKGKHVAIFAGAHSYDFKVAGPVRIRGHLCQINPVYNGLQPEKAFYFVPDRFTGEFYVQAVLDVRLVNTTSIGTENFLKSIGKGQFDSHFGC
jgi:hypothetical protein